MGFVDCTCVHVFHKVVAWVSNSMELMDIFAAIDAPCSQIFYRVETRLADSIDL